VQRRFVSIGDASRVTVGELRRTADRVGADVAVVVRESEPILTVHRGRLAQAAAADPIVDHLEQPDRAGGRVARQPRNRRPRRF
jgi:hypothetical protein